jgi:Schitoviridae HNH endonuclease
MLPTTKKESDVCEKAKEALITTRVDLVRTFPFMGFLIMSTDYSFTDAVQTMAATTHGGNKIFVNEKFINSLSREESAFVIMHECLHIFLEHCGRQTEMAYDHQLWNIATDFCINSHIVELNESRAKMPKDCLYDVKYKKMSADEIYHKLLEENDGDPQKAISKFGTPDEAGTSGMKPLDGVDRTPMTEAEKTENHQKISASLANVDKESLKKMGDGYADLIQELEELIESKIPWQQVLREFITTTSKNRYTYNRISRKSYHGGIVFPTMEGNEINLTFGIDTSGSMSQADLTEGLSELFSICEEFDNWKVDLISCDTRAHLIGEYDSEEGDDFSTIDKGLVGGGGTDLDSMIVYGNESEKDPAVIVIITDGYIPEYRSVDEIPVITVVTSAGNKDLVSDDSAVIFMES